MASLALVRGMGSKRFPIAVEGQKVVFASEMVRIEKKAISEGDGTAETYMLRAAEEIFQVVLNYLQEKSLSNQIIILCGKGNNGGDAYAVGEKLLNSSFDVKAYQLGGLAECSELCRLHAKVFEEQGGTIHEIGAVAEVEFPEDALVLDGLFGTGFKGQLTELMKGVISKLNSSSNPVIAIDIPSGVSGDTGFVENVAVMADLTVYVGFLKVGHLYNQGFDYVGNLHRVDFGLSEKYLHEMQSFGALVNPEIIGKNLPIHKRTVNKYAVGQVMVIAGSPSMPGAAILASKAALRSGGGVVRFFYPTIMGQELTECPLEVVRHSYSLDDMNKLHEELPRTKAILVGSGLGRSSDIPKILKHIYAVSKCPLVIDGDALFFFEGGAENAVLTPHKGELQKLLKLEKPISDLELIERAEMFALKHKVIIVFKGAPTTVIAPPHPKIIIPYGNKGMASAGMGDALAGIITSLIAQGKEPREAAILGAPIHALAGDHAKKLKSEYSMSASDLIDSLPHIFLQSNE